MQILDMTHTGRISSCRSDDGLVTATNTPDTRLIGSFTLIDAEDRPMWRGEYVDADGICRGRRVPEPIWRSAMQMMSEWSDHQTQIEEAMQRHAMENDIARMSVTHERIAAEMENPYSML